MRIAFHRPLARALLAALVFWAAAQAFPAVPQGKASQIAALAKAFEETQQFNGTLLVAEKGSVVCELAFGTANREWAIPHTVDAKLRVGSVTKQFTSMLVMQLVQQGRIDLQGKLSAYLPYYRKDVGDRVTIHHLLTHSSGIPSYTDDMERLVEAVRDPYPVDEFIKKYCSGDLQFEPGSSFRYDNSGYFILGAVVEAVTGRPYADVLRDQILNPLGMKNTGYDRPVPVLAKRASGYSVTLDGFENAPYLNMSLPYAAGALYSTVGDLYLWDRALASDKLLSRELKAVMFKPQIAVGGGMSYAYGWMVRQRGVPGSQQKTTSLFHGGAIFGFSAYVERLVDEGSFIAILSNTPEADLGDMADGIVNILHGQSWAAPKTSVAHQMYGTLTSKGVDAAIREYKDLKAKKAGALSFGPSEINTLGYHLLRNKRMVKEAIEIFKLGVEEFPKNANAYDSLGEAYMAAGDKTQAVIQYAKSLELNPHNSNAVEKLNELVKK